MLYIKMLQLLSNSSGVKGKCNFALIFFLNFEQFWRGTI